MDIPARSRQKAMDWSLVLASQAIGVSIHHDTDQDRWSLGVESADVGRAIAAIRQYEVENRRKFWRQRVPVAGIVFHRGVAVWLAFLVMVFWLARSNPGRLAEAGLMDSRAVLLGEWWRLFTAVTLHLDAAHLIANLTAGGLLLGMAMASLGPGRVLLLTFIAGAAGNLAGLLIYGPDHRALGASGMVLGALGLMTAESAMQGAEAGVRILSARGALLGGLLLFVLLGLNPSADVVGHVGGFVAGLVFGLASSKANVASSAGAKLNVICLAILSALVAATWTLALRSG